MTLDVDGNVIITGFGRVVTNDMHFQTMKYAANGTPLCQRSYDGIGTSSDVSAALDVDAEGNVYVTGLTTFPPQNRDHASRSRSRGRCCDRT